MPNQIARRRNQAKAKENQYDTQRVKEELQRTFSVLGFSYIYYLFLVAKYKSFLHDDNIQKRKLQNLLRIFSNNIFHHNLERVIFNFSTYELTDEEKKFCLKALIFRFTLISMCRGGGWGV